MSDSEKRIAQLENQVAELTRLYDKQSQMVAKTGEQVMQMSMKDLKLSMKGDVGVKDGVNVDMSDYVTNEDIVQLVGEMQQQFDLIEMRNIERVVNSNLSVDDANSRITPLTNKDGELPPEDVFPQTLGDFVKMNKFDILRLAEFYEIVIPQSEQDRIQQFISNSAGDMDVDQTKKLLFESRSANLGLSERVESYTDAEFQSFSENIAKYLGIHSLVKI